MLGGAAECKQTNRALSVSMRETVDICFDPPVCLELPCNWEDTFFREVAYERGVETNAAGEKVKRGVVRMKLTNLCQMCPK